jgi:ABC-type nitrate/sulfonate/bicarbonate transport system permease component
VRKGRLLGLLTLLVVAAAWELVTRAGLVDSISMVPLSKILRAFYDLCVSGEIFAWLGPSLVRLAVGFLAAAAAGVAVGLVMGYFRVAYDLLEPLVEFLRPLPSPAYIPIVMLFLGIDDAMKIAVIAFASFFPIVINTYSGVVNVDPVLVDVARTFGVRRSDIALRVVLPAALPYIFSGLRVSLGIALIVTVLSEMVAGNSGIGFFVLDMQRAFRNAEMFAAVLMLGIVGYLLNRVFLWIERRVVGWAPQFQNAND